MENMPKMIIFLGPNLGGLTAAEDAVDEVEEMRSQLPPALLLNNSSATPKGAPFVDEDEEEEVAD